MQCPQCKAKLLQQRKLRGSEVVVDVCAACSGIWFEDNELAEVLPTGIKDLRSTLDSEQAAIDCPACNRTMLAFNYPQTYVEIDMCPACCGIWLKQDEFREINAVREHRKKKGNLDMTPPLSGIKGRLIKFIDAAINKLRDFE